MKLLAFGEILWDIVGEAKYLGGAPLNLAAHAAQCGAQTTILSRLGRDALGAEALAAVMQCAVNTRLVQQDEAHPTGTVDVTVSEEGEPSYVIHESVAYDHIELPETVLNEIVAQSFDVFCFGTLAQRSPVSQKSLARLLKMLRRTATRIFYDVNLRQHYYQRDIIEVSLAVSDMVKLNEEEAVVLSQMLYGDRDMARPQFCERLTSDFEIEIVLVTLGAQGVAVYHNGQTTDLAGCPVQVADAIGAGDAFSAVFLTGVLQGQDPVQAAGLANQVGAYVASKPGALPPYSDEIKKRLREGAEERFRKELGIE